MRRFTYTPQLHAYINISNSGNPHRGKTIDISQDIVGGSLTRNLNAVSSVEFQLQNKNGKYLGGYNSGNNETFQGYIFTPMDRIIVAMSRIGEPFTVFTGYLDEVPAFQLFPDQVTIRGSCTLKRLLYSFFDPGLPFFSTFFSKMGYNYDPTSGLIYAAGNHQFGNWDINGDIGQIIYETLVQIGGWDESTVEIIDFPDAFREAVLSATNSTHLPLGKGTRNNSSSTTGTKQNLTSSGNNYEHGFHVSYSDVIEGLMARGVPFLDAVAVAGRTQQENSRWTNNVPVQHNDGGFGLFQWTGDRATNLINFAQQEGGNPVDLRIQLDFLIHENETSEVVAWQAVLATQGLSLKALVFSSEWERGLLGNTVTYAQSAFNEIISKYPGIDTDPSQYSTQIKDASDANDKNYAVNKDAAFNVFVNGADAVVGTLKNGSILSVAQSQIGTVEGSAQENAYLKSVGLPPGDQWCAAFTHWVFEQLNINLPGGGLVSSVWSGLPASDKFLNGQGTPQPGDLIFFLTSDPSNGGLNHIGIVTYLANGQVDTIEGNTTSSDPSSGSSIVGVHARDLSDPSIYGYARPTSDPSIIGNNIASSTNALSSSKTTPTTKGLTPSDLQQTLGFVGYLQSTAAPIFSIANILDPEHALIDTIPLFQWMLDYSTASARVFCSAPNGDFLSFFPDYFGWFGTTPYFKIEDIEVTSLDVQLSDDNLQTHVYGVGPIFGYSAISDIDFAVAPVASVQEKAFQVFIKTNPDITPGPTGSVRPQDVINTFYTPGSFDPDAFLSRYGARPLTQTFETIRFPLILWLATWLQFMQSWASTYTCDAEFTFMPELFPGGRVNIADRISFFVDSVTHSFNYETGFTTSAELVAATVEGTTLEGETKRAIATSTQFFG